MTRIGTHLFVVSGFIVFFVKGVRLSGLIVVHLFLVIVFFTKRMWLISPIGFHF